MNERFVVALDQGTTSSRAVLVDRLGNIRGMAQHAFAQHYPHPGWVEHDPMDILSTQLSAFTELLVSCSLEPEQIESIGITNQRETTIVWDKTTGVPVANAIVWQCRRTADMIEQLCRDPQFERHVRATTGLIPDAYFSASKIKWILDNGEGVRARAEAGELAFGTVDSWLIWQLTRGEAHATDPTNASRTMLYDIHKGCWDAKLLDYFDIPASMLPEVRPSSAFFGYTNHAGLPSQIPICGVAGDQQSALFGQCCFEAGQAKNTYGTGCFLLMHTGEQAFESEHRLITTIAASAPLQVGLDAADSGEQMPKTEYALEGSVFVAGALIQWLRDELGLIKTAAQSEDLAFEVQDNGGVYIVPAFTGLGAPYWDSDARGAIYGLTRGSSRRHIVRAALESLAYQVYDLANAMQGDSQVKISTLNVDGGASANNFLMQFQSDILDTSLSRPAELESTALGAAYLAGLKTGFWQSPDELKKLRSASQVFIPQMDDKERSELLAGWHKAIERTCS